MGLFLKEKKQTDSFWIKLMSTDDLRKALAANKETPKIFFKHSTRCGTSIMAIKSFENNWEEMAEVERYYIDVLRQRAVSEELAILTGVKHESPQVIVLLNGNLVYHDSHGDINVREIKKILS